ncbi:MAG: hypothetical protein ACTSSJ_01920 [Candidatus Odinarchaeia archaeon]
MRIGEATKIKVCDIGCTKEGNTIGVSLMFWRVISNFRAKEKEKEIDVKVGEFR